MPIEKEDQMMKHKMNRREFIKLMGMSALLPALRYAPAARARSGAGSDLPNILILVADAFSAQHASLYGYPRQTTPNLERFAANAAVYHNHYAAANFTTPGTASLLTGVYPWTHRAFNTRGTVIEDYTRQNIFSALEGSPYYRAAWSHNGYAVLFFNQFRRWIDYQKPSEDLFLADEIVLDGILPNDQNVALSSEDIIFTRNNRQPSSLFLSLFDEWRRYFLLQQIEKKRGADYPAGFPMVDENFHPFLLEDATDWLIQDLPGLPQPFLMYAHILPPHEPYRPRREFIDLFQDDYHPPVKRAHFFAQNLPQESLDERRLAYDRYMAFVDAELGRVFQSLDQNGLLDNTVVIFTSDHGQMFERGIHGHITPTLYHPLLHVPMLIRRPGQAGRQDIYAPTSAVDLLPTVAHLAGQPAPAWSEGQVLPPFGPDIPDTRSIFALETKTSFKLRPLLAGTLALIRGPHKMTYTFGFRDYNDKFEMYNLEEDPEEMWDIYPLQVQGVKQLRSEIINKLKKVDEPYSR
jgi:arylsulfatase A-like enzyme